MRYVSAISDAEVRGELMGDLSGLTIGSAFLLSSVQQLDRLLKLCDDAAKAAYDTCVRENRPAEVECITLDAGGMIGFDSLIAVAQLPEETLIVPVYRYFDTPREAIVGTVISSPSQIKKTREVTFFCGPDRRKTGDYRIFSIHPGPKRQPFPSRYQPEAQRRVNREYWDRHVFMSTPNQIISTKMMMRANYTTLEPEARDRVFHMTRRMEAALHEWYGTYQQVERHGDLRTLSNSMDRIGHYSLAPDGSVYYYIIEPGKAPPDVSDFAQVEPHLSNTLRPAVIRADGSEEYYFHGQRHRANGPALYQPLPDGGWMEVWYEEGLISRLPEEGPAKIIYDAKGTIVQEVAILKGAEVEATTLGEAAEPIKLLQTLITDVGMEFKWFEESQDFALLRGQLEFAANRTKQPLDKIVRQMQAGDEQVGLRWDFDRTLEQDIKIKEEYERMVAAITRLEDALIEGARAMRFVRGDSNIINGIWGKIIRDLDRLIERGKGVPAISEGKTAIDSLIQAKEESKKHFQSMADQGKMFSATGR